MRTLGLAGLTMAVVLSGCASKGLLSGDPPGATETFSVQADVQAAHRRAGEYVRVCHEERAHPYGVVYQSHQSLGEKGAPNEIQIFKQTEPAKILEIIRAQSQSDSPNASNVTVMVLGEGQWDQAEIQAARASIQSATPVCRPLDNK
ncbi:BPTD_2524 family lipoprotein [Bordetella muralis]|uniref:BPTD_2524 family lipoprotein n=1 Tax=Bordetella muralis TaxID=1649130 RepID=UPI0039EF068D